MNSSAISHILSQTRDPYPNPDYRVCKTQADLDSYFAGVQPAFLACDTESIPGGSTHCVTFSHTPGTGRLIYASNKTLLESLAAEICIFGLAEPKEYIHLLFHNYLHDCIPFEEMGIPIGPFTDTMVRAYNLCLGGGADEETESRAGRGSLSLKFLAYRLCHMSMTSFSDTVYPHSLPHIIDWLTQSRNHLAPSAPQSSLCVCTHLSTSHEQRGKTNRHSGPCWSTHCSCSKFKKSISGKPPTNKPTSFLYRKLNLLLNNLTNKPTTDPWDRIKGWYKDSEDNPEALSALTSLVSLVGPHPVPSIAHVPESDLLLYACRDADATLRIFLHMQHLTPWIFYR